MLFSCWANPTEINMELRQLWAVVRRRWWLVLIPAVVALILTLPTLRTVISPPVTFTTAIRFTASQVPTADKAQNFQDQSYIPWLASEYAVNNLATWMGTGSFAQEISTKLTEQGKTISAGDIRAAGLRSDSARSIMTLYLYWPNPDELKLIAQAAIDVLREKNQVYFPQFGAQKAEITPLDTISVAPLSAPITQRLGPLFRVLIGLVAGLALAFLAEYLDPTIRDRRDVEALGLHVIAEIPRG
jgi:capsular polysaccharide biosynthesis protein